MANGLKGNGVDAAPTALTAQLKAQQIEIAYLKKERESMFEKLKSLEGLPNQMEKLMSRLEQMAPQSEHATTSEIRWPQLESLKQLPAKVAALEDTINKRAAAVHGSGKLERDIEELKTWKSSQQTSSIIEANAKKNSSEKIDNALNKHRADTKDIVTRLDNRIDEEHKDLAKLSAGFVILDKFRKDLERQDMAGQLKDLSQKIEEVEQNESKTYDKVSHVDRMLDKYIGPLEKEFALNGNTLIERVKKLGLSIGQVRTLQSEQGKFTNQQNKLTLDQGETAREQERLAARVETLERKACPGFKKVGTTMISSSTDDGADQRLDRIDKHIKDLQQSYAKVEGLSSQLARVDDQTKTIDEHSAKLNLAQAESMEFGNRLSTVESQVLSLGDLDQIQTLPTLLAQLPLDLSNNSAREVESPAQPSITPNELASLSKLPELSKDIDTLDAALNEVEGKVYDHGSRLEVFEASVPALFRDEFDPVKERLKKIDQSLVKLDGEIEKLRRQSPRVQPPAQVNPAPPVDSKIPQELNQLRTTLSNAQKAVQELQLQISQKADRKMVEQKMDQYTVSFNNLQHQYNNITTEDLHARMVQWFLQNYPSNAANMLQQYASLQQDVHALQSLSAQVSWIQSRSEELTALLTSAPQLQALVGSTTELRDPQSLAKIEEACDTAKRAVSVADTAQGKANEHTQLITSLQQSLHNLNLAVNSPSSHLATTQITKALGKDLEKLGKDLQNLRTEMKEEVLATHDARVNAVNELRTNAGRDHELRVKEMKALKSSVASFTAAHEELSTRLTTLQEASAALRNDVDTVNNEFIEPNRTFFGLFGSVLIVVGQLQSLLESMNQNLPKAPIAIDWHVDLAQLGSGDANDR
jgi:hypothetical protein